MSYSLPRFGGVGHIEVGCVDDGGAGDAVCVSFWWLREPGWSKSSSAREVEGGVGFVGVDQLWVVGGCVSVHISASETWIALLWGLLECWTCVSLPA